MKSLPYFLFLFLTFSSCSLLEVPSDMYTLDKSFISVWIPSQRNNLNEAKEAFPTLQNQWNYFKDKYDDLLNTENEKETARLLQQCLTDAGVCIRQDDVICVRVKLDQFKFELQEIRTFWETDYYLDYLWDLEENVYQFIEIAEDPKLELLEWDEFIHYQKAINVANKRLEEKTLNADFFDLTEAKIKLYKNYQTELTSHLVCLNGLTEEAQRDEILRCAKDLQEIVYDMISVFGNNELQNEQIL